MRHLLAQEAQSPHIYYETYNLRKSLTDLLCKSDAVYTLRNRLRLANLRGKYEAADK